MVIHLVVAKSDHPSLVIPLRAYSGVSAANRDIGKRRIASPGIEFDILTLEVD